ncbi:MAG TPA: glycosyltransferase [Geobacteraceae bacterium]
MSKLAIDIIVPVWNRPTETRECLVNLAATAPEARLILVNNGSERETENLLEEFAEALDERALLISNRTNLGFVRAVNRGLMRVEAEWAAIMRNRSLVSQGWLEPLLALAITTPEAGVIVPRLVRSPLGRKAHPGAPPVSITEMSHGDFAAMLVRKELHGRIGAFDEEMDGGTWCLKDFSRRALRAGFLTFAAEGSPVLFTEEPPLGSAMRREEILARSRASYVARWGEERSFCVYFPKEADSDGVRRKFEVMLRGARQGHSFTVLVHPKTFRDLLRDGCGSLHRSIRIEELPRLFADVRAQRVVASLRDVEPGVMPVAGFDGMPFPGVERATPFAELERVIAATQTERYGEKPQPWPSPCHQV